MSGYGNHVIDLDDINGTADAIDTAVEALTQARETANRTPADMTESGSCRPPQAAANFQEEWSEWNTHLTNLIVLGPEFSKWLRNYAADAGLLDQSYS